MKSKARVSRSIGRRAVMVALTLVTVAAMSHAATAWADHQVVDRVSSGPAGGNSLPEPTSFTISRDGSRSFFVTGEALVPEDTDARRDVYERAGGITRLLSTGPSGGNGPFDAQLIRSSEDGSSIAFSTAERLVPEDADDRVDLYRRASGTTSLLSTGPAGGNGDFDVDLTTFGMSADGSSVVFETAERLTADDANTLEDLYLRVAGQTTRLTGEPVNPHFDSHEVIGLSRDGARVFFATTRQMAGDDDGIATHDAYKWETGNTTLQSVGPNGEPGNVFTFSELIDADGIHLVFPTYARLVPEDTDGGVDIYERVGDTVTRVSVGPTGGNGEHSAHLRHITPDGSHVFFQTAERLVAADTDSYEDLYVRAGGMTTLVSTGPLAVDQDFLLPRVRGSLSGREPGLLHYVRAVDGRGHRRRCQRLRVRGRPFRQVARSGRHRRGIGRREPRLHRHGGAVAAIRHRYRMQRLRASWAARTCTRSMTAG